MRRIFDGTPLEDAALAETSVDPASLPVQPASRSADETGDSAPYVPAASAPPAGVSPETPVATTREPTPPPAPSPPSTRASRAPIAIGVGIAVAGIAIAVGLSRMQASDAVVVTAPPPPVAAASSAPAVALAVSAPASASASAVASAPAPLPAAASLSPSAKPSATAATTATPAPKRAVTGGFADPEGIDGARRPVLWKVQGKQVRLLTRLVSNESNVADAVVKKAVEWNAWQYLRCYERHFGGAKDMPEGVVNVSFEIIDQLPRHAKVASTTFTEGTMADCVRSTLLGQTINAAGPDGKGSATHAFRFVPVD